MAQDNLTAVLYGINDLRLEKREVPTISDTDVLIKIDCVGICGSDVHYLKHGRIGDFVLKDPMVIGHEASGIIVEVGSKVKNLVVGDRVAIEPGVPCRLCEFCKGGRYNLCPDMVFCATPPYNGNLTRYYKHPSDFCYKLPDHVSMEEGALLEPLSVGVHACRRGKVGAGSDVLILGAGPIGLVSLLTAKAMGASTIMITDIAEHRLEMAKKLGATHTIQVKCSETVEDTVRKLKKKVGILPDRTIDCCGAEDTTRVAILVTRSGGCVVIVGMASQEAKLPLLGALAREVDIKGVFRYCNDYPAALSLVASGKVDVFPLITHHFTIEETQKAFDTAAKGQNAIKVMIHVQPEGANNICICK